MVKYFLQPQLIRTVGDPTNSWFIVNLGVAQGSPLSPTLFNIFIDVLARALEAVPRSSSSSPATLYADDVILLALNAGGLHGMLDICSNWASKAGMIWNTKIGKSMALFPDNPGNPESFTLAEKPLSRVYEADYLGVSITSEGISNSKSLSRVQTARERFKTLAKVGLHGRGLSPAWSLRIYKALVRPMFEYMIYMFPEDKKLADAVGTLE